MKIASRKVGVLLCLLLLLPGCWGGNQPKKRPVSPGATGAAGTTYEHREELLAGAIDNLNSAEDYPAVYEQIVERLQTLGRRPDEHFDPLLAALPEPKMLRDVVDRLNQWIRGEPTPPDWKPDAMLAALPKSVAELEPLKHLDQMAFSRFDGYALQEAVLLRDVSLWARGSRLDELERAKCLFDWIVRNIQLDPDYPERIPRFPFETLLFGQGTWKERAWLFVLLLRQQEIDAAVLAVPAALFPSEKAGGEGSVKRQVPWCVGVLIEGKVYLFDPLLGLPIPAPNGVTRDAKGRLEIQPATLDQAVADRTVLDRLNVDESRGYGLKAADLKHVSALVEASPAYLALRMKVLESQLAGDRKIVLSASPTAQAARWKAAGHIAESRLWQQPFDTLLRRSRLPRQAVQSLLVAALPFYKVYEERTESSNLNQEKQVQRQLKVVPVAALYKGRRLNLKGRLVGEDGAARYYQVARPSNAELGAASTSPEEKSLTFLGKYNASYWLGLIAYEVGNYDSAVDYFTERTLNALPGGPRTNGAYYNLARTYEASGEIEQARLQYGSNASSPGYLGDLLRRKWLKEGTEKTVKKDEPRA